MQDEQTGAAAEDYDVWRTPLRALDEFGLGISLYFRQLVVMSGFFLSLWLGERAVYLAQHHIW